MSWGEPCWGLLFLAREVVATRIEKITMCLLDPTPTVCKLAAVVGVNSSLLSQIWDAPNVSYLCGPGLAADIRSQLVSVLYV